MPQKIAVSTVAHKCQTPTSLAPAGTPSRCLDDDDEEITYVADPILALVANVIGRKQLAHRMHWSPSMLKQAISGEKTSFIVRTEQFIELLLEIKKNDLALAVVDRFSRLLGAAVISAEQVKHIQEIAEKAGTRVSFDEWTNGKVKP